MTDAEHRLRTIKADKKELSELFGGTDFEKLLK